MNKQVKKNAVKKNTVKKVAAAKAPAKKADVKKAAAKAETKKTVAEDAAKTAHSKMEEESRKAYAAAYYKKNAEKIREASRRSHAKRRVAVAQATKVIAEVYDAVCGLVSERGYEAFDRFYKRGGQAMMAAFDGAVTTLAGRR